jgi:hypothetical protein
MKKIKNSKKNKTKNSKNGIDGVEIICGRQIFTTGTINVVGTLSISPASFTRALAVADVFQFYRFTMVKVIIPATAPTATTGTGAASTSVAYAPGAVFDTPPTTIAEIIALPKYLHMGNAVNVDKIMTLNQKDLLSHVQLPWFKTIVGTEDTQFEIQGNLYYLSSIVANASYIIEYRVEFQSPNLAGNSPMIKIPYPLFQKYSTLLKDAQESNVDFNEHGSNVPLVAGQDNFKANIAQLQVSTSPVINFDGNLYKRIA